MLNVLLLCVLILLWGTSFLFVSLSLASFSPLGIVALRVFIGGLVLFFIMKIKGLCFPKTMSAWGIFAIFAVMGNTLPFYLISLGQQQVSSGIAGLLMAIMPLMTMILAHYCLEEERFNRFKLLGFLCGISGVAIVLSPTITTKDGTLLSSVLILFAALCYAMNSVLVRRLPRFNPIIAGAGVLLMASAVMIPLWLIQEQPWQQAYHRTALMAVLWLGAGSTGIATLLYFLVIDRAGATFLANINYVIPIVAYFAGAWVLGESLYWYHIAALAMILMGIALTNKKTIPPIDAKHD